MCTFAWTWKDTISRFCINDGELVGNIWEKKKRGESWEGICSIWNLVLGQKHHICLVKQFRMSLIQFVRLWRSIIMNLDALLHLLSNDNWQLKSSMSCGCESYEQKIIMMICQFVMGMIMYVDIIQMLI
jgi:hypothetical protein